MARCTPAAPRRSHVGFASAAVALACLCGAPAGAASLALRHAAGTSNDSEDLLSDEKADDLLEKLQGVSDTAAELEASMVTARQQLESAEEVLSNETQNLVRIRPAVGQLARASRANQRTLSDMMSGAGDLTAAANAWLTKANGTEQRVDDNKNATDIAVDSAEKVLSMGQIKSRTEGCLDSPNASVPGGAVQAWTCLKAQSSQQWEFTSATGAIKHLHGICLSVASPGNPGAAVAMSACVEGDEGQNWTYDDSTGLVKNALGNCLSVANASLKGSPATVAACSAEIPGQQWKVVAGSAALKLKLEELGQLLWKTQDVSDPASAAKMEEKLTAMERDMDALEHLMVNKSQEVLGRRLRRGTRRMRGALRNLAIAALGTDPPDAEPAGALEYQPIGADLGLA